MERLGLRGSALAVLAMGWMVVNFNTPRLILTASPLLVSRTSTSPALNSFALTGNALRTTTTSYGNAAPTSGG